AQDNNLDIRLMINHDMIANNSVGNTGVRLMPYSGSESHTTHASTLMQQYTYLTPYYGSMNSGSSDSHPFWQRGYPVIYYFELDFCPYYHSDLDITANIDPVYCAEVIRASLATTVSYSRMPSAPYNAQAQDTGDGNSLQVSWTSVFDPDYDYNMLYYGTSPENLNSSVVAIGNSHTLNNLTTGQTYYLKLTAVSTSGYESLPVSFTGTPNLIPVTPTGFGDMPYLNSVRLLWDANAELDLAGYLIYRSQSPEEPGVQITPNPITSPVYYDYDVIGSPELYYYYRVCSIDLAGNQSPLSDLVKSRPVTLNSGILIVDETQDFAGTNPLQPSDEQVDLFYQSIMDSFQIAATLDLASASEPLRLADIGVYSSILWHANDFADMSYPFAIRDALSAYLSMGGKLFYTGYHPTTAFALNTSYPANFDPSSYLSSVLGIAATEYNVAARFRYATPRVEGFPQLTVDNDKTTPNLTGHLFHIETLNATTNATSLYSYGSDYEDDTNQGQFNGDSIGLLKTYDLGKAVILSFPLYNMLEADASALVNHVFHNVFLEPSSTDDPLSPAQPSLSLGLSYPNPFSLSTRIPIKLSNLSTRAEIGIFNL
ncbi:MAG TPA: fibronectin type III domain-containing protein, partial [Candidatus Cloacimonadota bacterium]|nr:fibronectin type III domain-containing protein [Candidatus Cloacimonadota bacterium]